jgi:hypothetical protein
MGCPRNRVNSREQLLKLKTKTIFSDFAVDERGFQIANNGLFIQWQDGSASTASCA